MARQLARKPARWAKRGPNARTDPGDEAKARALARNRAACQVTPLVARPDGTVIDGNRTLLGLELEGMLDVELDFIITDEDLTPDQVQVMQINSAFHREDLPDCDKAAVMRDVKLTRSLTNKQLAESVLSCDPSLVTRYLSLFDCVQEVQEAARAGKLRVSDWYAISKSPLDAQNGLLAMRLSGEASSRDALERQGRKKRGSATPAVRASKIKIRLSSGATVTVSGEELSLDDAIEAVKEATKEMVKGRDQGLDARTLVAVCRDKAKTG